jgi:Berberine and berberine like
MGTAGAGCPKSVQRAGCGYLGFLGDEGHGRVQAAYTPTTWATLRQVKRRYDPDNLFAGNHNIPPSQE